MVGDVSPATASNASDYNTTKQYAIQYAIHAAHTSDPSIYLSLADETGRRDDRRSCRISKKRHRSSSSLKMYFPESASLEGRSLIES